MLLKAHSAELQTKNASIEKALKDEFAKHSALDQYITALEQQLAALRRARFGKSSEQLDQHIYQFEFMLEDLGEDISEQHDPAQYPQLNDARDSSAEERKPPAKKARLSLLERLNYSRSSSVSETTEVVRHKNR